MGRIITKQQLRTKRKLSASAEKLLQHVVGVAPAPAALIVTGSGIPPTTGFNALLALMSGGYLRAERSDDREQLIFVTRLGQQHARQMRDRAA